MSHIPYRHVKRRTRLVNLRLQGGAAVIVGSTVLVAGILIAPLMFRDVREALWDVSHSGHYRMATLFPVVEDILVRRIFVLFLLVFAAGSVSFVWYFRWIRRGMIRLLEVFGSSEEGDLSTTADPPGPGEIADFGREVDRVRSYTRDLIGEIRDDVSDLRKSPPPQEEFLKRWDALKEMIGRVAP